MNGGFVLCLLASSLLLVCASGEDEGTVTIQTLTGRTYENAKVSRVLPEGLVLSHANGVTTVPFRELSQELRDLYGYDPVAAARSVEARRAAQAARTQANQQARAQAQERAAQARMAQAAAAAQGPPAKIVSAMQMKNYWLNTFPQPGSLDRDFHQKKKEYEELMALIRSGKLDNQAQRQAFVYNIAECQRVGDLDRAASIQTDLAVLDAKIAEEKRAAQLAAAAANREQLQYELHMLNHAINQLNTANMLDW